MYTINNEADDHNRLQRADPYLSPDRRRHAAPARQRRSVARRSSPDSAATGDGPRRAESVFAGDRRWYSRRMLEVWSNLLQPLGIPHSWWGHERAPADAISISPISGRGSLSWALLQCRFLSGSFGFSQESAGGNQ